MTQPTITECVELARKKTPFRGRHVFGELREGSVTNPPTYVVYSYDHSLPLYVYDYEMCQWFGLDVRFHSNAYNKTTISHLRKFKPYSVAGWHASHNLVNISLMGYHNSIAYDVANRITN